MTRAILRRYQSAFAGLPREVWLLAIALFVNRSGTMVMPFMTLYLTSQLGMKESAAGWIVSVFGLGSIGGSFLGGRLSDRFGAVRVQTVCMFLAVPCFLIIPMWKNWLPIAVTVFALALAAESVRPASAMAIARLTTSENRTRAFALQRLAANLGMSIGPALGGLLATIDFRMLFLVDGLTALAAAISLLWFFRMRRPEGVTRHDPAAPARRSPLADAPFACFLALILANSLVFFQFGSTYPLYLRDHFHLTKPLVGLMFAVNTVLIVVFEMVLVDVVKFGPLLKMIGWGCFLCCLGFGMLPFGSSLGYCVLAMVVVTMGEMLAMPLSAGYAANRGPVGSEGLYVNWYTLMVSISLVVGPAIGGLVYAVNPDAVWLTGLGVGGAVLVGFQLLAKWPRAMAPSASQTPGQTVDVSPIDVAMEESPAMSL